MTFCPFCGVRQDIDLRQVHFRDLGTDASMLCPECSVPLGVIEMEAQPPLRIERCGTCHGAFFNSGELEASLEAQTNPLVWIDHVQLEQIAADFGYTHEVTYRKCPMCEERMSHLNFGGRSGVILDRCGTHGVWVEGGELRRLAEWWRAGGKHLHQQNEAEKAREIRASLSRMKRLPGPGKVEPEPQSGSLDKLEIGAVLFEVIGGIASSILD